MHLSIVVPVLNEAEQLPGLMTHLAHLQSAARVRPEVLFVDGGSTDGSRELLRGGSDRWITARRGRCHQLNAGAAAATGDCLVFLHADTRLPDNAVDAIREAAEAGAAGGFLRLRLDAPGLLCRLIGALINLRSRLTRLSTGDQVQWLRRDVFEQVGGFAPIPLFEDLDLSRRLRRAGHVAAVPVAALTSARRWRQRGVWRTVVQMWALRLAYWLGVPAARLAPHYEEVR